MREIFFALALVACTTSSGRLPAREIYNDGLEALDEKRFEEAEEKLLEARNHAGLDPELRYRAAYNLGMAFAHHADTVEGKPREALKLLRQARDWFRDAVKLRPGDDDARVNIEVVERRIQIVTDKLLRAENTLEKKLERIISDQRTLRDSLRKLMTAIAASGDSAEPVGYQGAFWGLAKSERMLLGDAGDLVDLAGAEIDRISEIDDKQLQDADRVKLAQMKAFEQHLNSARTNLSGARRLLRKLQGSKAHERADAALADLKRAAEQLQHPVVVLKGIARDQLVIAQHTSALATVELELDPKKGQAAKAPPWLTTTHLAERQRRVSERAEELAARFEGATSAPEEARAKMDAKQKRLLLQAAEALPHMRRGIDEMKRSIEALGAGSAQTKRAAEAQGRALEALARAIEAFSDIRGLVNLAYAAQQQIIALLSPGQGAPGGGKPLSTAERAGKLTELTGANVRRLERLKGLIGDELASIASQGEQIAAADPKDPNAAAAKQKAEQQTALYTRAEELRGLAATELAALAKALAGRRPPKAVKAIAEKGAEHLGELRKLFYTLIEHLEQLVRDQSETRDRTATAHASDDDKRKVLLGPLVDNQSKHGQMGTEIAAALTKQADAMSKSGDEKAIAQAEKMSKAAEQVNLANDAGASASSSLTEARDAQISYDMQPILDAQQKVIEHLNEALRILKPPKDQNDKQQQEQQKQQEQEVSKQQAQRRLQQVREREQARRRKRKDRERLEPEPVEKDW